MPKRNLLILSILIICTCVNVSTLCFSCLRNAWILLITMEIRQIHCRKTWQHYNFAIFTDLSKKHNICMQHIVWIFARCNNRYYEARQLKEKVPFVSLTADEAEPQRVFLNVFYLLLFTWKLCRKFISRHVVNLKGKNAGQIVDIIKVFLKQNNTIFRWCYSVY